MTMLLLATRAAIITWITLSLIPVEIMFNAIETEIERRDWERGPSDCTWIVPGTGERP